MELKGSKTEQNLMTAFAGESQAHVKYGYYASQAKNDGYNQIGAIFSENIIPVKNTNIITILKNIFLFNFSIFSSFLCFILHFSSYFLYYYNII